MRLSTSSPGNKTAQPLQPLARRWIPARARSRISELVSDIPSSQDACASGFHVDFCYKRVVSIDIDRRSNSETFIQRRHDDLSSFQVSCKLTHDFFFAMHEKSTFGIAGLAVPREQFGPDRHVPKNR